MAKARNDFDRIDLGRADSAEEGVEVRRLTDGRAVLVPRALRDLRGAPADLVADLQHVAGEIARGQDLLDGLVPECREAGLSWNSIGWCLGISSQAARQRWGTS
jgi:hypothetical protein